MRDFSRHPCFNARSRDRCARIHLPVAPLCNVQCNFCDCKYCCVNESRPGVSAAMLSPAEALRYVDDAMARMDNLTVAGIAGPGDPFANSCETIETLRLVRDKYPHLLLCVSSNGLDLAPHVEELADIGITHATVCKVKRYRQIGAYHRGKNTARHHRPILAFRPPDPAIVIADIPARNLYVYH